MLKKILAVLALALIILLSVAAMQPGDFRVTRAIAINAPAETVFAQINDFHKWQAWSPWAKMDPAAKNTYEGNTSGVGAGFSWAGNSNVGEGRMTIVESHPSDLIKIKLEFLKPFASTNMAEFAFNHQGSKTTVSWTMTGAATFLHKVICLFVSMDKMVGADFEKGLAGIKAISEATKK